MTSRELVKQTLEFQKPERIPLQLWTLPWAVDRYPEVIEKINTEFPDDIVLAPPFYKEPLHQVGGRYDTGRFIDEWGCEFINIEAGIHGEVKEPIVQDWNDLSRVRIPEERLTVDIASVNDFCRNTDCFVLPDTLQRPFERLQFIRKTDNLFIDLIERPSGFTKLLGLIHEFHKEEIKLWCKTDVDGIFIMDDWGAQNSLLINPKLWAEIFKPLYRDYINIAHQHGKYAFMHSDGNISAIIPELIDLGLDALNSQLFCMNIEELGENFKGKITFWGEIDRQYLLPHGIPEDIDRAVQRVYRNLYADGGVIGQCEFGPGGNPENVLRVFRSWSKL